MRDLGDNLLLKKTKDINYSKQENKPKKQDLLFTDKKFNIPPKICILKLVHNK